MIVSCAPLRVSFAGGGSDIAAFYRQRRGAVLSCAIAKYSFIVVHPYFSATKYHLKYARTELVDRLDEIQHPILREALRMQAIERGWRRRPACSRSIGSASPSASRTNTSPHSAA
jgi:D-glycero-alpha-D-manno-heptose-7-phosphate kinase